ncbi:MAG TPA: DUF167 domain-containing protein [Candidatus Dormibacteraeota bacterium]|nr:DUF167 domain-containing protein [Candidatus Dormibacteraeota bacterium]
MVLSRRIAIVVHARSSRRRVEEVDDALHVWLTSAPVQGSANRELMDVIADHYGVARSAVTILRGHSSRHKLVEIR